MHRGRPFTVAGIFPAADGRSTRVAIRAGHRSKPRPGDKLCFLDAGNVRWRGPRVLAGDRVLYRRETYLVEMICNGPKHSGQALIRATRRKRLVVAPIDDLTWLGYGPA